MVYVINILFVKHKEGPMSHSNIFTLQEKMQNSQVTY